MNVDPDKQREELQRILALKRLETPPPRFFRGFSDKVLDGLNSPPPAGPRTMWQRLGLDFDSRPVLVCASGVVVCGVLGAGIILAMQIGPTRPARGPDDQTTRVVAPSPTTQPALDSEGTPVLPVVERPGHLNQPVIVPGDSSLTALRNERQPAPATTEAGK